MDLLYQKLRPPSVFRLFFFPLVLFDYQFYVQFSDTYRIILRILMFRSTSQARNNFLQSLDMFSPHLSLLFVHRHGSLLILDLLVVFLLLISRD